MLKKVWDLIKKIFPFVLYGILGIIVLLTLWLAFDKFILKSPAPSVFGFSTLTIETGSMNGTSSMVSGKEAKKVSIGDLIVIKKTNDYKIGDVITFIHDGESVPTTHRIIGYTDNGYITKGDANNSKDTVPVLEEEILGEVVGHYPKLGQFASWVKVEGWFYIAGALAILAIGGFLIKLLENNENNDDNNSSHKEDNIKI